jgi:ABC-type transport system involved in cytochrome bd biosynthesis fused ATPase/permease subunit
MENIILNISEFIENNFLLVISWFLNLVTIILVIITPTLLKSKNRTINLLNKSLDDITTDYVNQVEELKSKKAKEEFIHNEERKKLKTEFEDQVKLLNITFEEELEKRSHFTQATIDKLRLQIKDLKDSRRKLAIEKATGLINNAGAILTSDELVEAAEKIYKFYTGK